MKFQFMLFCLILSLAFMACHSKQEETSYSINTSEELAQQIGDLMAGVDESGGGSNGSFALNHQNVDRALSKAFARLNKEERGKTSWFSLIENKALASACSSVTFGSCSSGIMTKNFSNCSLGVWGATMSGSITLTFSPDMGSNCRLDQVSDSVSRVPNFEIRGLRGASFQVGDGVGAQTVTRTGPTNFKFTSTGIRRTFTTASGDRVLDMTTATQSDILGTLPAGLGRLNRSLTSGTLRVTNNLNGQYCDISPSSVTWGGANCNCPTSGSFTGNCSDSSSFSVAFHSTCGSATVSRGSESREVTLDRCF